jgi:hypothetical protein
MPQMSQVYSESCRSRSGRSDCGSVGRNQATEKIPLSDIPKRHQLKRIFSDNRMDEYYVIDQFLKGSGDRIRELESAHQKLIKLRKFIQRRPSYVLRQIEKIQMCTPLLSMGVTPKRWSMGRKRTLPTNISTRRKKE